MSNKTGMARIHELEVELHELKDLPELDIAPSRCCDVKQRREEIFAEINEIETKKRLK